MVARTAGRKGRPWRRLQRWVWATYTHCYRCGEPVDQTITNPRHPRARSVDHIIALARGGHPLDRGNATLSHYGCNASAGSQLLHHGKVTTPTTPTARVSTQAAPSRAW